MKLHNKLYDLWMEQNNGGNPTVRRLAAFEYAKAETQRNWQSVVEHHLLPHLFDEAVCEAVRSPDYEWRLYTDEMKDEGVMPVEFSTAAYRLMHSKIAGAYRLNVNVVGRVSLSMLRLAMGVSLTERSL